jgi:hypothetical protein
MTAQMIDPFSITVLRGRRDIAVAHNSTRRLGVQVLSNGALAVESGEWTAYKNNGGDPLVVDPDAVFLYLEDEA